MHAEALVMDGGMDGTESVSSRERDPRVDPQPGDVLALDRDVRQVIDRVQDSIEYGFPSRAATRWLPLIRWQAWARLADVKKVAP
jgi:hypothetical protein